MRVISIQFLLCCFMFLSHGTDEIECRCKKKKKKNPTRQRLCYQRNTGGSFGTGSSFTVESTQAAERDHLRH